MKYQVVVTRTAKDEADAAYQWLRDRTEIHSTGWFNGLVEAVESLDRYPQRCPLAPESRHFRQSVRELLYGKRPHFYRVLFVVDGSVVQILHIRHGARSMMKPEDIIFQDDLAGDE